MWHFESAHAANEPTPAQIKAQEWLPEAMLFPAVLPSEALVKEGDAACAAVGNASGKLIRE